MTVIRWSRTVALLALFGLASFASGQSPDSPDGLVKVTPRRMEMAWLRPGADFRPYTKVMVDPTQVAFQPNWMKDYNLNAGLGNWVTQEQANKIMAGAQTNFDDIFRDAFKKAGYEVVTAPGADVLRVNSAILDLVVNAPLGQSTGLTTWIISAGQATLIVEVRDSTTNALLGRVADRQETQQLGRQIATTATNVFEFRQLFTLWAGICANALGELKSASPIPKDLKPNQRL
jgi:mannose/fructose/N-acetylgalactosamine-specific phosphotransferase system component IIB